MRIARLGKSALLIGALLGSAPASALVSLTAPSTFAEGSQGVLEVRVNLDDVNMFGFFPAAADVYEFGTIQYSLNFGDGTSTELIAGGNPLKQFMHTYSDDGIYTATVEVIAQFHTKPGIFFPPGTFPNSDERHWTDSLEIAVAPVTTPVPEPEIYVMLLAGLGLLGFEARRRKNLQRAT